MSFGEAVTTCLRKYANFADRASRPEYWWFFLFTLIVYVVAAVLDAVLNLLFVIQPIAILALLLPGLAAGVRRLHDTGRSGWWYFIALVPFIGGIWLLVLLAQPSVAATDTSYAEATPAG